MTIGEYIRAKFQSFGYDISEADFLDMDLNPDDEADNILDIKYQIAKFIPSLLMRANVTESGFSVSFNTDGIIKYYNLCCKDLGIDDELSDKPKVTFL